MERTPRFHTFDPRTGQLKNIISPFEFSQRKKKYLICKTYESNENMFTTTFYQFKTFFFLYNENESEFYLCICIGERLCFTIFEFCSQQTSDRRSNDCLFIKFTINPHCWSDSHMMNTYIKYTHYCLFEDIDRLMNRRVECIGKTIEILVRSLRKFLSALIVSCDFYSILFPEQMPRIKKNIYVTFT